MLSASVDINGLIESGGGTGPLKPRQPAQGASLSDQVPNPAQVTETNEETRTIFRNLFSTSMRRGFFISFNKQQPRKRDRMRAHEQSSADLRVCCIAGFQPAAPLPCRRTPNL